MILIVFNPNIMKNAELFYYTLDFAIDYISVFFGHKFLDHYNKY